MKKILLASVIAALGTAQALAADMAPRSYAKAPVMAVPASSWQGLYVGGNVGYGWGDSSVDAVFLPPGAFNLNNERPGVHSKGAIGGAQLGYNFQWGQAVFGLETDIQGSGISGSASIAPLFNPVIAAPTLGTSLTTDQKISWFGTSRARVGFSVTPDLLLYGTAGAAYGGLKATGDAVNRGDIGLHSLGSLDQTKLGWAAGGGAEWMFARNWSAKVEYLYLDLGSSTVFGRCNCGGVNPGVDYTWRFKENIVRAGVNYHLGAW
jgi:outer membrane immunogenic protein